MNPADELLIPATGAGALYSGSCQGQRLS